MWINLEVRYATLAGGGALLAASWRLVSKTLPHRSAFARVCAEVTWTLCKDDTSQIDLCKNDTHKYEKSRMNCVWLKS